MKHSMNYPDQQSIFNLIIHYPLIKRKNFLFFIIQINSQNIHLFYLCSIHIKCFKNFISMIPICYLLIYMAILVKFVEFTKLIID